VSRNRHGSGPQALTLTYRRWKPLWKTATGTAKVQATARSLRHFFVSALIAGGASVKQVQTVLGHASPVFTLGGYAHHWPGDDDRNLLTATVSRSTYEHDLKAGINRFRWVVYSVSATLMIILISFYSGITGINAVICIAGANVAMILFGWLQEVMNPPGRTATTMLPFWFGTLVGLAPWISIAFNIFGSKNVPGFIYGIVLSEVVLFSSFGLNQWLQYRRIGKWTDYAYGEKTYLVLSLVAKSLLAWQIFGGSLAG